MDSHERNGTTPASPDHFDRLLGLLDGLPEVERTQPSTVCVLTPLIGKAETFIIRTVRQREVGDVIFVEHIGGEGSYRIILPTRVADVIARQRDALTSRVRARIGRANARAARDAGHVPTFTPAMRAKGLATRKRN